eukprot:CAMPEP_0206208976 /NCGR_PEP_ID=MMETSP0166-20121206/16613_1 /ASSEMBLY_ACC=CAM_ASM_000260 /TAXON_ID=95228 /ORGANISM="Vannella robusta, Strain DIVA3 518/3/11/1/6" /LENGTH=1282 /DNA_ID=CAMNT_0053630243 /DNA_START=209 /DNA_END=4054 /DNA_ORIENTATION=+
MSDLFSDLDDEFSLSMKPNKSGGNLSNLFGGSPKPEARKQPAPAQQPEQKEAPKQEAQNRPSVLYAIAGVICHKYNPSKNGYDLIGKIGAAVLGVAQLKTFQILLYRSNDDHVAQIPLSSDFQLSVQNELFASFADTRRQNWSIKFPSVESISLFCMHLTIAKSAIAGDQGIVTQDILPGSGTPIGEGDQVKLTYSGYLVQENKVGKMFDSNLASEKQLRFAVGSEGKVVRGLHEGVKGMMKRGRRIIVVPSLLAYGDTGIKDRVPPNSTLVYQVDLAAVKLKSAPEPEPAKEESSAVISDVDEEESKKQEVINRVKKFGVSMGGAVPVGLKPKDSSESSVSVEEQPKEPEAQAQPASSTESVAQSQAAPAAQPSIAPQQAAPSSTDQQLALLQSQFQQFMQMQMQQQGVPQQQAPAAPQEQKEPEPVQEEPQAEFDDAVPYSNADNMKFLHDTKMIHEEIKTSVVTAANKIETLQRDIKNTIFGRDDEVSKEKMSGTVLIQTITSYVEQNEQLQREVVAKGERIDELREKAARILEKNKLLIEEHTNTMEERNNALTENTEQARKLINSLRDEKLTIEEKLHSATEDLSNTRSNLSKINHSNMDLSEHLSSMKSEILNLRTEANGIRSAKLNEDSESTELRNNLRDEQAERKRLEEELEKLEEQLTDAKEILQKYRDGMEERKQKWIQIKAQMDKAHEDEKLVAMRQMKAQLLKMKKEKDEAVEECENIEHNVERRWRENIARLKTQFKERVDELKEDLADDHQRDLQAAITDAHDTAKRQLKDTQKMIEDQYQAGFKAARHEQLSAESSAMITERENRLEGAFKQRKQFMNATIKKIMANIFYSLREDMSADETYQGGEILVTLMDAVKQSTLEAMQTMKQHFEAPAVARDPEIEGGDVILDDEIVDDENVVIDTIDDDEGLIEDDELIEDVSEEPGDVRDLQDSMDTEEEEVSDEFSDLLDTTPKVRTDMDFEDLIENEEEEVSEPDEGVDEPGVDSEIEPEEVVEEAEEVVEQLEETIHEVEEKLSEASTEEVKEELEHTKELAEELVEDLHEAIDQAEEDLEAEHITVEEISLEESEEPESVTVPETTEPEAEPEPSSTKQVPAMVEEVSMANEPETTVESSVDLPDSTFSSDPFGVSKQKPKTFKSDDIFANKKQSASKKTDFSTEDIFGSSTPKKTEAETEDDFFGGSPSTPKKAEETDDDFFTSFSPKPSTPKKSPNQPPDLFIIDITSKGKSSSGDMFAPKKKTGLDDIFGSGSGNSSPKKEKAKTNLDDIFS